MKKYSLILFVIAMIGLSVLPAHAQTLASQVAGKILLDVEDHGEAWYVDPTSLHRYYLPDGDAAYHALETFGLGVSNADLAKIPVGLESRFALKDDDQDGLPNAVEVSLGTDPSLSDTDGDGFADGVEIQKNYNPLGAGSLSLDAKLAHRLSGHILLQVQTHGEAWYVDPADERRYYLGNGEAAYQIMRYRSLGVSAENLSAVAIGDSSVRPPPSGASSYQSYTLATSQGSFAVKVVALRRDTFDMVTDTGDATDCSGGCTAKPLADYVQENDAFAGIHGSYFCPPDYSDCAEKTYTYYPPAFNSALHTMINDDTLKFHDRPVIAQTTDGQMHYFHRGSDFGDTLAAYQSRSGLTVSAALGNWPSLLENGVSVVDSEPVEQSFSKKSARGGIGWDDQYFYLVIASNATVFNLASVFEALKVDYAMNLDGGGSAALYYDGAYKAGPGRLLPNAIVFRKKTS